MFSDDFRANIYACVFTFLGAFGYSAFAPDSNSLDNFVNNLKSGVNERVERFNSFFHGIGDDFFSLGEFLEDDSLEKASLKEDYSKKESFHGSDLESKINFSEQNSVYLKKAQRVFDSSRVPVLMFHRFSENEDRYTVSPGNFRKLLEELYLNDFYSVSLEDFVSGDFSGVPVGRKPVLLTFDDASVGQFRMLSDGSICDKSAVGILEDFYSNYDFGGGGVFFVNYGIRDAFSLPFGQDEWASDKAKFLVDNGYSFMPHTVFHDDITYASKNNIFEQKHIWLALAHYLLGEERFDNLGVLAFAGPGGSNPVNESVYDYKADVYDFSFDAWGGASVHPLSQVFDPNRVTRIEMTYHTRGLVFGVDNLYRVSPETKRFYDLRNFIKEAEKLDDLPSLSCVKKIIGRDFLSVPSLYDFRGTY